MLLDRLDLVGFCLVRVGCYVCGLVIDCVVRVGFGAGFVFWCGSACCFGFWFIVNFRFGFVLIIIV